MGRLSPSSNLELDLQLSMENEARQWRRCLVENGETVAVLLGEEWSSADCSNPHERSFDF
jgi:hypothetical protein